MIWRTHFGLGPSDLLGEGIELSCQSECAALQVEPIGADNLGGLVFTGIITIVALTSFFILREISRLIGEGKLWYLFFQRRSA
jgi:hypothetical protein